MPLSSHPEKIGDRIGARRKQLRRTQKEMAAAIGVRQATISDWENGKEEPTHRKLVEACEYLQLPLATPSDDDYIQLDLPFDSSLDLEIRATRKTADSVRLHLRFGNRNIA